MSCRSASLPECRAGARTPVDEAGGSISSSLRPDAFGGRQVRSVSSRPRRAPRAPLGVQRTGRQKRGWTTRRRVPPSGEDGPSLRRRDRFAVAQAATSKPSASVLGGLMVRNWYCQKEDKFRRNWERTERFGGINIPFADIHRCYLFN
jgi:hypothetical protein